MFLAGPEQQPLDQSDPRRTSTTASSRSQFSPPDPNSKLRIRVIPAGPQLQALDRSFPRRTRTASSGSECSPPPATTSGSKCSPPDLHRQAPDQSVSRGTSTASSGSECSPPDPNSNLCIKVFPAGPQPRRISKDRYTR